MSRKKESINLEDEYKEKSINLDDQYKEGQYKFRR